MPSSHRQQIGATQRSFPEACWVASLFSNGYHVDVLMASSTTELNVAAAGTSSSAFTPCLVAKTLDAPIVKELEIKHTELALIRASIQNAEAALKHGLQWNSNG